MSITVVALITGPMILNHTQGQKKAQSSPIYPTASQEGAAPDSIVIPAIPITSELEENSPSVKTMPVPDQGGEISRPIPAVPENNPPLIATASPRLNRSPETIMHYGHLPYSEAERVKLSTVGQYGGRSESLHREAAFAYQQMEMAAEKEGVYLLPISGFRDYEVQAELFEAQINRRGTPEAAAKISAPSGHSEHHTGYAIDIGDRDAPETDIETTFEQTPAFAWLDRNASQFGFELSFPRNNPQNVSYEPWHWRFVGSSQATQTFQDAFELKSSAG